MRQPISSGSFAVIKVGSSSLTFIEGGLDPVAVKRTVNQVADAWDAGYPSVLVTSAAVAAGIPVLGLASRPIDLPGLQVAAAVGQVALMSQYAEAFARRGLVAGQVLLTKDVLANREQYVHSREALETMLRRGIVPVVNENDTVVIEELKLGDNDRLAAIVAHLVDAEMLIMLTDTDGLYTGDPRTDDEAELLQAVRHNEEVLDHISTEANTKTSFGSGGVSTKVVAARMAAWSGIPTVIAAATNEQAVVAALRGQKVGTYVAPRQTRLAARKLWIAFGVPTAGTVSVDDGAAEALVHHGRSLLSVGVVSIQGSFPAGAAVEVVDLTGGVLAKGIATMGSEELIGPRPDGVSNLAIHRDDLVVFSE
jgi:glutamate 5-kinase